MDEELEEKRANPNQKGLGCFFLMLPIIILYDMWTNFWNKK